MNNSLNIEDLKQKFLNLSAREQFLVFATVAICLIYVLNFALENISNLNTVQKERLNVAERDLNAMPNVVERHMALKLRQKSAEKEFENIKLSDGALAHIENLIKDVAGIPQGYLIKDKAPQKFSEKYQQLPFQVTFNTTDFERLINFLMELENGEKPLILSSLNLTKSGGRNPKIRVQIVASAVEKIKS